MVRDERKRGSSLKIPFKSLFGMFSPNLATEKLSRRYEVPVKETKSLEKDDDSCTNCFKIDVTWSLVILQLIAEEFLFCSFKDTKLRKFTLELLENICSYHLFNSKAYTVLFVSASSVDEVLSLEDVRNDSEVVGSSGCCTNGGESAHVHPACVFCLYHLGVKDFLSVSMICKSLHTTVCDDSLLWKHIHICQLLNEKISEDALLRLTEKAQGTLQCLRLVDCCRITDDCLKRVLDRNPQVVKLGVPGCTRINIDGILSILRDLKSVGKLQVHLEIGGLFGVTKDHFVELFDLLNIGDNVSTAGKEAMQKKEDRMSVSTKRSYYHLFDVSFHSFSLQEWSNHYDLIRQTIVVHSDWFGSILEFLYGSLPRPPDVLYVFSPKPTFLMVVQVQDAAHKVMTEISSSNESTVSYVCFKPLPSFVGFGLRGVY